MKYEIQVDRTNRTLDINGAGSVRARLEGQPIAIDAVEIAPDTYSILLDGRAFEARVSDDGSGEGLLVRCASTDFRVQVRDPRSWRGSRHGVLEAAGPQRVLAPMPGKIVRVLVATGDKVEVGQGLVVVEAMKMQNEIRAPKSGRVERVLVVEGQAVRTQEALLIIA
jgi:acetyl/propionyl-CoA carboxylase alpha subunit